MFVGFWEQYGQGILWILIIVSFGVLLYIGYHILKKKLQKKMDDQQQLVNQHKMPASILVLEKRKDRITNANVPKAVIEQVPKVYRLKKVPIVKAKIGPQVLDLLCDEAIFDKLPERKTVQVELAGIYIAGLKPGKR